MKWFKCFPMVFAPFLALALLSGYALPQDKSGRDSLPSWNDGRSKKAIVDFVTAVTDEKNPKYVVPEQRIAVFDNDGTLWVEQPIYTQLAFAFDQVKVMAASHPDWKTQEPFQSLLSGNKEAVSKFGKAELLKIIATTHSGMTQEAFDGAVKQWLAKAKHPRFDRPYTDCVYQPMLEVMKYLRETASKHISSRAEDRSSCARSARRPMAFLATG